MTIYLSCALLLSLAMFFGYINHKLVKMETTIAIFTGSLVLSGIIVLLGSTPWFADIRSLFHDFLNTLDFKTILMQGMLPYLLFSGSINIDIDDLKKQAMPVGVLSTISTIASTVLIGYSMQKVLSWCGVYLDMGYCLLFGALISPTDPIAVLGVLKNYNIPNSIRTQLAGESLFNDGVGIVLFITMQTLLSQHNTLTFYSVVSLFVTQALGGMAWGMILGMIMYLLLKDINDYKLEVLVSLAVVTAGYAIAGLSQLSGPLAMVVSGIFIGNRKQLFSNTHTDRSHLTTFWELIDEILNAILFLLIGLEMITIDYDASYLLILLSIPVVLLSRYITVAIPLIFIRKWRGGLEKHLAVILTWGGLRGGLAIALALSLPESPRRDIILALTYAVVVFSILIQGSTIQYWLPKKQLATKK